MGPDAASSSTFVPRDGVLRGGTIELRGEARVYGAEVKGARRWIVIVRRDTGLPLNRPSPGLSATRSVAVNVTVSPVWIDASLTPSVRTTPRSRQLE